jgi:hypothetical protein
LWIDFSEKWRYTLASIASGGLFSFLFYQYFPNANLIGTGGIYLDIQSLVGILFPFLVASLVAVSTFQRDSLDRPTVGRPVTITMKDGRLEELTRREFACILFAYCALISLLLFIVIICIKLIGNETVRYIGSSFGNYLETLSVFVISTMFSNLIIFTLWGMYYLTYRINN